MNRLKNTSDEEIMSMVSNGGIRKMSVLFDRHHLHVYNYYKKMTRDEALSEDLTQNVFERMLKHRRTYKIEYPFKAWMFRIAKNLLSDHYRKKKIKVDSNRQPEEVDIADNGIVEEQDDRALIVKSALAMLKSEYKEVLLLTRYENLPYKEVANIIGISENGVKARVHRALKQLKVCYTKLSAYEQS